MKLFLPFFFLLISFGVAAQFETPKRKVGFKAIPLKANPNIAIAPNKTSSDAIKFESKFLKSDSNLWQGVSTLPTIGQSTGQAKEEPRNSSELYTDRFNKKEGVIEERFKSDTFLGEFKTGSKTIKIGCRDHEAVDGDRVRIWVNGVVIANDIFLESAFRELFFELKQGFNVIEFEALNQGESGPNTAQFVMFDDKNKLVTSNIWNLTTGVKAKVIIVKENQLLKKVDE